MKRLFVIRTITLLLTASLIQNSAAEALQSPAQSSHPNHTELFQERALSSRLRNFFRRDGAVNQGLIHQIEQTKERLEKPPKVFWADPLVLLLSSGVSDAGTSVQVYAEAILFQVYFHHVELVGVSVAMLILGRFLTSLIIGSWLDRVTKPHYIASTVSRMIPPLLLAGLVYTNTVQIWHVMILSFFNGVGVSLGSPIFKQILNSSVHDKQHMRGLASTANQGKTLIASSIGPGLGATIIYFWGFGGAFLVNAISYLFYILGVVYITFPEIPTHPKGTEDPLLAKYDNSFSAWRKSPSVIAVYVMSFTSVLLAYPFMSLLPALLKSASHADLLPYFQTSFYVGNVLATVVTGLSHFGRVREDSLKPKRMRWPLLGMLGFSLIVSILFLHTGFSLVTVLAVGFCQTSLTLLGNRFLEMYVPEKLYLRVEARYQSIVSGLQIVGLLMASWVAYTGWIQASTIVCGFLLIAIAIAMGIKFKGKFPPIEPHKGWLRRPMIPPPGGRWPWLQGLYNRLEDTFGYVIGQILAPVFLESGVFVWGGTLLSHWIFKIPFQLQEPTVVIFIGLRVVWHLAHGSALFTSPLWIITLSQTFLLITGILMAPSLAGTPLIIYLRVANFIPHLLVDFSTKDKIEELLANGQSHAEDAYGVALEEWTAYNSRAESDLSGDNDFFRLQLSFGRIGCSDDFTRTALSILGPDFVESLPSLEMDPKAYDEKLIEALRITLVKDLFRKTHIQKQFALRVLFWGFLEAAWENLQSPKSSQKLRDVHQINWELANLCYTQYANLHSEIETRSVIQTMQQALADWAWAMDTILPPPGKEHRLRVGILLHGLRLGYEEALLKILGSKLHRIHEPLVKIAFLESVLETLAQQVKNEPSSEVQQSIASFVRRLNDFIQHEYKGSSELEGNIRNLGDWTLGGMSDFDPIKKWPLPVPDPRPAIIVQPNRKLSERAATLKQIVAQRWKGPALTQVLSPYQLNPIQWMDPKSVPLFQNTGGLYFSTDVSWINRENWRLSELDKDPFSFHVGKLLSEFLSTDFPNREKTINDTRVVLNQAMTEAYERADVAGMLREEWPTIYLTWDIPNRQLHIYDDSTVFRGSNHRQGSAISIAKTLEHEGNPVGQEITIQIMDPSDSISTGQHNPAIIGPAHENGDGSTMDLISYKPLTEILRHARDLLTEELLIIHTDLTHAPSANFAERERIFNHLKQLHQPLTTWSHKVVHSQDPWNFIQSELPSTPEERVWISTLETLLRETIPVRFVDTPSVPARAFQVPTHGGITIVTHQGGVDYRFSLVSRNIKNPAAVLSILLHEYLHVKYLPEEGFLTAFELRLHEAMTSWKTRELLWEFYSRETSPDTQPFKQWIQEGVGSEVDYETFSRWYERNTSYTQEMAMIDSIQRSNPNLDIDQIYRTSDFHRLFHASSTLAFLKPVSLQILNQPTLLAEVELWRLFDSATLHLSNASIWAASMEVARWFHEENGTIVLDDIILASPSVLKRAVSKLIFQDQLFPTLVNALLGGENAAALIERARIRVSELTVKELKIFHEKKQQREAA